MATDSITLNVKSRKIGKGTSRSLRNEKLIPAMIYGSDVNNHPLCIDELSVERYSRQGFENSIFTLNSENKDVNGKSVLMKTVDVHPVTRRPLHVDFYALDMKATVKVSVEIEFNGTPKGVKEDGGLLQIVNRSVEVECLPNDIPEKLTVDITGLGLNEALHSSNLELADGVKLTATEDITLVSVTSPKAETEETPAEEAAEGEAAAAEPEKK